MAIDFSVYLVDEVTAVGDKKFKNKCKQAFTERRQRSTIIMVSHDMKTIDEYCDRCLLLDEGQLRVYDDMGEAKAAYEAM